MLPQRIITAVILGILTLAVVSYLPPQWFNLLALLVILIAAWEFSGLFKAWNYVIRVGFLLVVVLSAFFSQLIPVSYIIITGTIWWLVAPYFLWQYTTKEQNYFTHLPWQVLVGIVMFIPSWVSLVVIRSSFGIEILIYLLVIIWAADVGAYFVGRFWGQHLLAPKISPKKTFEGLAGGIFLALLVAFVWIVLLQFKLSSVSDFGTNFSSSSKIRFLILTIVSCLWSTIGDLFESMLKREAQVKDSGKLLPGHGGMYDRIDSLIAALPIFTLGLLLI
jgi:phosphatidate cytidylyltransferase